MPVGPQSGFDVVFQEVVYYAGPIIQLGYWLVMIVAALWAVVLLKRWVDFQTGASRPADTPAPGAPAARSASPSEKAISVDEFVE